MSHDASGVAFYEYVGHHSLIDLTIHVLQVLPRSSSILLISLDRGCRVIEMRVLHRQLVVLQLPLLKAGSPGFIEIDAGE